MFNREALAYLTELGNPVVDVGGNMFWRDGRLVYDPAQYPTLLLHTLQGLVDLALGDVGLMEAPFPPVIHIAGIDRVWLISEAIETPAGSRRREYATAKPFTGERFPTGRFMDSESFIIEAQSKFVNSSARNKILAFASGMQAEAVATSNDDGVAQAVTVRRGVQSLMKEKVENPVYLRPYTTFSEVLQPEHTYILRLKGGSEKSPAQLALFEVENGEAERQAMASLQTWFAERLKPPVEIPIRM